ncbi:MAG: GNAT family N-acetyltransferase, partial [Lachnospiraceae bacterium]|nr:GNAT family N-acetyltransferase [Lachnospiraceae bacterium]
ELHYLFDDCFGNEEFDPTFGGEEFDVEEVAAIFEKYANAGILLLYKQTGTNSLAGFAAAVPLSVQTDVLIATQNYLSDASHYWYHAELGIGRQHQGQGLGRKMACELLLNEVTSNRIIMRARIDNDKTINLHKTHLGFKELLDKQGKKVSQWCPAKRKVGAVLANGNSCRYLADERIFLELYKA